MKFTFAHNNFNVIDLDKSLKFYEEALGLKESDGSLREYRDSLQYCEIVPDFI